VVSSLGIVMEEVLPKTGGAVSPFSEASGADAPRRQTIYCSSGRNACLIKSMDGKFAAWGAMMTAWKEMRLWVKSP